MNTYETRCSVLLTENRALLFLVSFRNEKGRESMTIYIHTDSSAEEVCSALYRIARSYNLTVMGNSPFHVTRQNDTCLRRGCAPRMYVRIREGKSRCVVCRISRTGLGRTPITIWFLIGVFLIFLIAGMPWYLAVALTPLWWFLMVGVSFLCSFLFEEIRDILSDFELLCSELEEELRTIR